MKNLKFKNPFLFTLNAKRAAISRIYKSYDNHIGFELRLQGVRNKVKAELSESKFAGGGHDSSPEITGKEFVSHFDEFFPRGEVKSRLFSPNEKKPLKLYASNPRMDDDEIIFDLDSRSPSKRRARKFDGFRRRQLFADILGWSANKDYILRTSRPSRWYPDREAINRKDIRGARLINAYLKGHSFEKRDIHQTDFRDSNLKNANFKRVKGFGAWFRGANLRNASFNGNELRNAGFEYSDLHGATGLPSPEDTGSTFHNASGLSWI